MDSTEALKILEESKAIIIDSSKNLKKSLERVEVIEKEIKELAVDKVKNAKLIGYLNSALNFFSKKVDEFQSKVETTKKQKEELETKRVEAQKRLEERKADHSASSKK